MRIRALAAMGSIGLTLSLVPAPPASADTCSWTYRKPSVTGFCFGQSVSLVYRRNALTGFIEDRSISVFRNGTLWTGFAGSDSVTLTRIARDTFSGFVGGDSVLCNGPLPVACLAE